MRAHAVWPLFSVTIEREEIPVEMMSPRRVPDRNWRFVDAEGHGHFWQGESLPTLYEAITGTQWVGDEYDGEEITITEFRCRQCDEAVKPGYSLDYTPEVLWGPTSIVVEVNGERFALDERGYAESVEAWVEALRRLGRA